MCEGCLMARGVVRGSPARDATLPGRLRRMRRNGSDPYGPRVCPSLLGPSFAGTRKFRVPVSTLWGARTSKSLFRTGWRVGQRRAGRCGGWVLARAAAPVGILHVRWRCCPCYHAWTSRFYRL